VRIADPAALQIDPAVLQRIESGELESWEPAKLLEWALRQFAPRIALSASFGSPEGMVLLHMMHAIDPAGVRVFTIDTGRLPQETYDLIDRVRGRYGVAVEISFPRADSVQAMVCEHGPNLFYESLEKRRLCCAVRKVEPLARVLANLDAWITGLRREQSESREDVRLVHVDALHGGLVKVNPLAAWSRSDVDSYVTKHRVPVNLLHARGYPSVGCAPCTRAVQPGEHERAGRWWWESENVRECGIHTGDDRETKGSGI
jgi:thioredoxin-dependent adenylylsulfate APS reductase